MLTHPTVEKLHELRCPAMAKALVEQFASTEVQNLSFEERLGLLVDRGITERHSRQLHQPTAPRQASPRRVHRRHRLPTTARIGQGPRPVARRWTLDPRAPQLPHHRSGRRGKDLARLCAGPQRVPQWTQRFVPAPAAAADRTGHRTRRTDAIPSSSPPSPRPNSSSSMTGG